MFRIDNLMEALPTAIYGMLGVFIVITAIFLCVKLMGSIFKDKEEQ